MQKPPIFEKEEDRLKAVRSLGILDTEKEERFDAITAEAAKKLNMPISAVSIIDEGREWYKSCYGSTAKEGELSVSFCGHTIVAPQDILIVEDTLKDSRFFDNPHVTGAPFIRFYAGIKLFDRKTKMPVGVFCVKDNKPRQLSVQELGIVIECASIA